jgi:hypothetical protein
MAALAGSCTTGMALMPPGMPFGRKPRGIWSFTCGPALVWTLENDWSNGSVKKGRKFSSLGATKRRNFIDAT